MWPEKTKNGKTKFREQYKDPLTGKYKKVSVTLDRNTNQTRRKAQIALERKIQDKLKHVQDGNIKKGITLGQVIEEWEPVYKKQVLSSTFYSWLTYKKQIETRIGFDTLVDKITAKYLINLYEDMLYRENYDKSFVIQLKAKINHIMKYAYQHDYVSSLPTAAVNINWPKNRRRSTIEEKFLDDNELNEVIDYIENVNTLNSHLFASVCRWMTLTGMRFGEAATLQVKNVHEENEQFYAEINGTLVYHGLKLEDEFKSPFPKTDDSFRTIILPENAVKIYREFSKDKKPNDYLFLTFHHTFIKIESINNLLRGAKKKFGIKKTLTTHTFRHTHVSKLAELGVPLYIIQKRLGHSDSKITSRVYLHVTKKAQKKYNEIIKLL